MAVFVVDLWVGLLVVGLWVSLLVVVVDGLVVSTLLGSDESGSAVCTVVGSVNGSTVDVKVAVVAGGSVVSPLVVSDVGSLDSDVGLVVSTVVDFDDGSAIWYTHFCVCVKITIWNSVIVSLKTNDYL